MKPLPHLEASRRRESTHSLAYIRAATDFSLHIYELDHTIESIDTTTTTGIYKTSSKMAHENDELLTDNNTRPITTISKPAVTFHASATKPTCASSFILTATWPQNYFFHILHYNHTRCSLLNMNCHIIPVSPSSFLTPSTASQPIPPPQTPPMSNNEEEELSLRAFANEELEELFLYDSEQCYPADDTNNESASSETLYFPSPTPSPTTNPILLTPEGLEEADLPDSTPTIALNLKPNVSRLDGYDYNTNPSNLRCENLPLDRVRRTNGIVPSYPPPKTAFQPVPRCIHGGSSLKWSFQAWEEKLIEQKKNNQPKEPDAAVMIPSDGAKLCDLVNALLKQNKLNARRGE